MRKLIFSCLFLSIAQFSISQENSKKDLIFKDVYGNKVDVIQYYQGDSLKYRMISFTGQNHDYQYVTDLMTFYFSKPAGFSSFLDKIIDVFNEEPGTTVKIDKLNVTADKKTITISIDGEAGYRVFNIKFLKKIKTKYDAWYEVNK